MTNVIQNMKLALVTDGNVLCDVTAWNVAHDGTVGEGVAHDGVIQADGLTDVQGVNASSGFAGGSGSSSVTTNGVEDEVAYF